ncbi:MAG TPA: histidine phosphatase family protein [Gammaproteobacteria bacterium]|nr:histidine phosphatase family protein [Gammaproteobacteria bacterium]
MREKEKSTRVIYVRHGQADFPHDRLYCDDREDPGLTAAGLEQARYAARMLATEAVDVIYASPMLRTLRTAEEIVDVTGAPLHTDERLKERPFGIWDGLFFDDIARDYPDGFKAWKADPVNYVPEGGEAIRDHRVRIKEVVSDILHRHPGELIVIVAHVGPIRMCITDAIGMPVEGYRQLTIDYGALTRVDYGRRQNNLVYMNYRYHPQVADAHAI